MRKRKKSLIALLVIGLIRLIRLIVMLIKQVVIWSKQYKLEHDTENKEIVGKFRKWLNEKRKAKNEWKNKWNNRYDKNGNVIKYEEEKEKFDYNFYFRSRTYKPNQSEYQQNKKVTIDDILNDLDSLNDLF